MPPHQQEDPAVLTISQIESDPELKKEVDLQTMYKQFGIKCLIAEVSVLPEHSIKPFGKHGPWKVYDTYHKLATVVHALKGATGIATSTGEMACTVSCARLNTTPRLDESFDRHVNLKKTEGILACVSVRVASRV